MAVVGPVLLGHPLERGSEAVRVVGGQKSPESLDNDVQLPLHVPHAFFVIEALESVRIKIKLEQTEHRTHRLEVLSPLPYAVHQDPNGAQDQHFQHDVGGVELVWLPRRHKPIKLAIRLEELCTQPVELFRVDVVHLSSDHAGYWAFSGNGLRVLGDWGLVEHFIAVEPRRPCFQPLELSSANESS